MADLRPGQWTLEETADGSRLVAYGTAKGVFQQTCTAVEFILLREIVGIQQRLNAPTVSIPATNAKPMPVPTQPVIKTKKK
jgi:hypothetical protein